MDLYEILESLKAGDISVDEAGRMISLHSVEEIEEFAKIDISRRARRGIPEVIFAETKELIHTEEIIKRTLEKADYVLVSRIRKDDRPRIIELADEIGAETRIGTGSSAILFLRKPVKPGRGKVGILAAGTSDIGVAEESRLMCDAMGCRCITSYDVGIAGIQRIFPVLKEMIREDVDCIIVVAGMEGALATLVSSMVDIPVIGVPTSVGYGYGQKGVAALASMLQSCSSGLSVVNIDNGIAAGGIAANIANRATRRGRLLQDDTKMRS